MDTISDTLIRIKNAGTAGHKTVTLPYSKLKEAILSAMAKEGFVVSVTKKETGTFPSLLVEVAYEAGVPRIIGIKRISKPSKRVYYKVGDLKPVRQGFGRLFLSTPKGIMTNIEARKEKVGGEVLFSMW